MSESKLQTKVLAWLKSNGFWAIKIVVCNKNGVMDIVCCSPTGTFVGIELKYGDNKPSPLQLHQIKEVVERGGIAFVAWDLDTVKEKLKGELLHGNTKTETKVYERLHYWLTHWPRSDTIHTRITKQRQ